MTENNLHEHDLQSAYKPDILFSRMENTLGITGQALAWFKSYLSGQILHIKIDESFSELQDILWSVPQGSVLGKLLFLIYLLPLGKLIRKHGLELYIWVIPCQLTHFIPGPSPILMKFVRLGDPPERLTHTKFQLIIIIIIDEATALQRFLKFIKIFDFGTQNIL